VDDSLPRRTALDLGGDDGSLWHKVECPKGCSYRADRLEHGHEEHKDGSRAVWMLKWGAYELVEFQGSLGF